MEASPSPLVSVILPFHNASTLAASVESILNQSHSDFELILVNNACDEYYENEASKLASTDHRIKLIKEKKKGVVFAANKAIIASKGQFIMRMDADDYAFPNRIELQLKEFEKDPNIGVVSGMVEYVGSPNNEGFSTYVNWLNTIQSSGQISISRFVEFPMANPSMMFRRELFDHFGLYTEGDFPEDYEFFLRLMSGGVKMTKVNQYLIKWVDSETRLTRTDSRYNPEAFYRIKAKYLADWLAVKNEFHPNIYVWGAGRLSRRRSDFLKQYGIQIDKYIDLKNDTYTIHYGEIPAPGNCFIVSYVSNRGIKDKIRAFLNERGYIEGVNYILAA